MHFCATQTYASAYTGHARINRMLFIADNAPTTQMQLEALKIAAEEARQVWRTPTCFHRTPACLILPAQQCGVRMLTSLRVRLLASCACDMLTEVCSVALAV